MNWVSKRETTRVEDIAYCLLGIFEVNMTLLYGEGLNAFRRLQEEILKRSDDQSILTWCTFGFTDFRPTTILATHPREFRLGAYCVRHPPLRGYSNPQNKTTHNIQLISNKLLLSTHLYDFPSTSVLEDGLRVVVLDCIVGTDLISRPAIILKRVPGNDHWFWRVKGNSAFVVEPPVGSADELGQLVGHSDRCYSPVLSQFDKRTKLYRSVVSGLDSNNGRMADISIVEDTFMDPSLPLMSLSNIYNHAYEIRSRIVEFNQHGIDISKHFRVVGSVPAWMDNQNLTLRPNGVYVVAFENDSSAFFVIWGYRAGPFILPLQDLFRQLQKHRSSIGNCTVTDILGELRRARIQGFHLEPFSEGPKIIGEPGSTQFQVEGGTRLRTWLGSRVLEVTININNYTNKEGHDVMIES